MIPLLASRGRLLVVTALISGVVAGCGSSSPSAGPSSQPAQAKPAPPPDDFGHVHGLSVVDGDLIIATHTGLWRSRRGTTEAARVGTGRRDVMGFTGIGDRIFGSGHPDPADAGREPGNVGVIRSSDGGRTWTPVALAGEVDFHAFGGAQRSLYGFDGASGRLLASEDEGRTWQERKAAPRDIISVAANPRNPRGLIVATPDGVQRSPDGGRSFQPTDVPAGILAWGAADAFAVAADGSVQRSADGGRTWRAAGSIRSLPVAAHASADALYVAREDGTILVSTDKGSRFTIRTQLK